ncbi:BDR-repeat family protein, partial (plasmid) [Borrelia coriaceae ATCC 43381]
MQESSLQSVGSVQVFSGHITEDMIYQEFIRLGMQEFIANDLSKRYYHNELTYKDIEYLETNFNLQFEKLEEKIDGVEKRLEQKIDGVKDKINDVQKGLEDKINGVEKRLEEKIDGVEKRLEEKIDGVRKKIKKRR